MEQEGKSGGPAFDLRGLRTEYTHGSLDESDLRPDPIEQFSLWFNEACNAKIPEPNAMTLATVGESQTPSARIVLLKGFDSRGFVFYTNYASRKGQELATNPNAALVFFWEPLERQVRIEGTVEKTSRQESEAYFRSRPYSSQIGAWVSHQGEQITSRQELERRDAELRAKFADGLVPLPDLWGGYRVLPHAIEFWQGRPSRLHDRLVYKRAGDGSWLVCRLAP